MNPSREHSPAPIERVPTGVPGLDEVLQGGLLRCGVYIVQGVPGAGKTILANQIVHHHAAGGGQVVYVTLLAESHSRLLQHMQVFSFYQPSLVPDRVYYVSAFSALRSQGLKGVVDLLRSEMRSRHASLLVLDGLVMAASAASSDEELKVFISDLQMHSALVGCTTLLLASDQPDQPVSAEQTMVDGILLLRERAFGVRRERNLEVAKFRGSPTLRGNHAFGIGPDGIVVYPRLEAARRAGPGDALRPEKVSTGVAGLDAMFELGGYARGSSTAICGPSGSGKTTLALHFLAQASPEAPAVFLGFYERPETLRRIAEVVGVPTRKALAGKAVEFMWYPFGENSLDAVVYALLDRVERMKAARVVIDGMGGLLAIPAFKERGSSLIGTLANELRRLGATTVLTVEEEDRHQDLVLEASSMSAMADCVVDLRLERQAAVVRSLGIRKSRMSRYDTSVRQLSLSQDGFTVLPAGVAA